MDETMRGPNPFAHRGRLILAYWMVLRQADFGSDSGRYNILSPHPFTIIGSRIPARMADSPIPTPLEAMK
jgi:hypothetical protein